VNPRISRLTAKPTPAATHNHANARRDDNPWRHHYAGAIRTISTIPICRIGGISRVRITAATVVRVAIATSVVARVTIAQTDAHADTAPVTVAAVAIATTPVSASVAAANRTAAPVRPNRAAASHPTTTGCPGSATARMSSRKTGRREDQ
jgi:hypothetical protein